MLTALKNQSMSESCSLFFSQDGKISYEEFAAMMKAGTDWRIASRQYSRERFSRVTSNLMKDGSLQWLKYLYDNFKLNIYFFHWFCDIQSPVNLRLSSFCTPSFVWLLWICSRIDESLGFWEICITEDASGVNDHKCVCICQVLSRHLLVTLYLESNKWLHLNFSKILCLFGFIRQYVCPAYALICLVIVVSDILIGLFSMLTNLSLYSCIHNFNALIV